MMINANMMKERMSLQDQRDQSREESRRYLEELEKYRARSTRNPVISSLSQRGTEFEPTLMDEEPVACSRLLQLHSEQEARANLERILQAARDEKETASGEFKEGKVGSGARILQYQLESFKECQDHLREQLRNVTQENETISTNISELQDQVDSLMEELRQTEVTMSQVTSEVQAMQLTLDEVKAYRSKAKAAIKQKTGNCDI